MLKFQDGRVFRGLPEQVDLAGTDLVRNGDSVHRRWCYHVRHTEVVVWQWPDGKTRAEVAAAVWLRFCRSCRPLEQIPDHLDGTGGPTRQPCADCGLPIYLSVSGRWRHVYVDYTDHDPQPTVSSGGCSTCQGGHVCCCTDLGHANGGT